MKGQGKMKKNSIGQHIVESLKPFFPKVGYGKPDLTKETVKEKGDKEVICSKIVKDIKTNMR